MNRRINVPVTLRSTYSTSSRHFMEFITCLLLKYSCPQVPLQMQIWTRLAVQKPGVSSRVNFRRVLARPDAAVEPLGSPAVSCWVVFCVGAGLVLAAHGGGESRHPLPPPPPTWLRSKTTAGLSVTCLRRDGDRRT